MSNALLFICLAGMSISFNISWFFIAGGLSYFDLLIPLLIIIFIIKYPKAKLEFDFIFIVLALLSVISGISSLLTHLNPSLPPADLIYFFRALFFTALYFLVKHWPVTIDKVILSVFFGLLISVFISTYVWTTSPRYFAFTYIPMFHVLDSPLGIAINRNQAGMSSALAFVIAFYSFLFGRFMNRFFSLSLTIFLFIFSLLTFSKGTWVLMTVGFFLVIFARYNFLGRSLFFLSLGIIIPIAIILPSTLRDSIFVRVETSEDTNLHRIQFIYDAFEIGSRYPFFGIGPGNYGAISSGSEFMKTVDPHNAYLQTFSELGFFAFFLLLLLYAYSFLTAYRARITNLDSKIVFILLGCLFVDGFVSGLSLTSKYLYILVALIASIRLFERKNLQTPSKKITI